MDTAEILKKVRQIEIQTDRLVSETFAGEYLSTFKGQGIEFAEVREYIPGDDVRSIDWNVTARTGVPYIKKFNETRELTLMIACDVSGSQQFGSRSKFKQQAAAELSALFAFCALQNNDKVGLLLFSDEVELYVPPRKGKKHILRLIRELIAFEPRHTKTNLNLCLETLIKVQKHSAIVVLISDFLQTVPSFEKAFKLAAKKFDLIPVRIQDPLEKALPDLPLCLSITDPETGETDERCLSDGALNRQLSQFWASQQKDLEGLFTPCKTEPILIDTSANTADPVVRYFKRRAKKIRK
ncbi:MAG: DUF58 domain-containing protein [Elusimicrobiaceae bacterium]|nr:DUF58 domain-containing protein [Elusimicrobiaceae bacterium]